MNAAGRVDRMGRLRLALTPDTACTSRSPGGDPRGTGRKAAAGIVPDEMQIPGISSGGLSNVLLPEMLLLVRIRRRWSGESLLHDVRVGG